MGCCQNSKRQPLNEFISQMLKDAIDHSSQKRTNLLLNLLKKRKLTNEYINKPIFTIRSYSLNCLAYCFYKGNHQMFKFFISKASLGETEKLMENQGLRVINLICFKGHLELLKHYLPFFVDSNRRSIGTDTSYTLDFNTHVSHHFDLAIHSACRAGNFQIVSFLYEKFKDEEKVPKDFDIYALDEVFEEDAGLVACRAGYFTIVKYLHEFCGVDFRRLNRNKENAVMVCVSGNKKCEDFKYLEVVCYLVEIVGLSVEYMYEELLIVADGVILEYLERSLEKKGIFVKKCDVYNPVVRRSFIFEDKDEPDHHFNEEKSFFSSITSQSIAAPSFWYEKLDF